jgi:ubiquinone/menaquinone biosynthesis C-methylase UbiE
MAAGSTKQAEKEYLARTGSATWEQTKPFSHPGADTLGESAQLLHDFSVAMLMLRPEPDDRILDLGAGGCWCSDLLSRLNRRSVAVDIAVDMLRAGRARPGGAAIPAAAGDLESLPFRSGSFQKAVCLSAIHHVPDIPKAVAEIARVLDDTGVAFFSEPGRGHAEAPHSVSAMQDFGVLEQDILIADFSRWCRDAGFRTVEVKMLSHTVPAFSLTPERWDQWSRLSQSTRSQRVLAKAYRALLQLFGFGKGGPLFEEALGMEVVRTLHHALEEHPIIVASKAIPEAKAPAATRRAALEVTASSRVTRGDAMPIAVRATNTGTLVWKAASRSGLGQVNLGVQVLDQDGRLLARDHFRVGLPRDVRPGESVDLTFECPTPSATGRYRLKFDLVAEGVAWFEAVGSPTESRLLDVE